MDPQGTWPTRSEEQGEKCRPSEGGHEITVKAVEARGDAFEVLFGTFPDRGWNPAVSPRVRLPASTTSGIWGYNPAHIFAVERTLKPMIG